MRFSALFLLLLSTAALAQCTNGRAPVQIAKLEFQPSHALTPELQKAIREDINSYDIDGCHSPNEIAERARDLLQQRGYFKALVEEPPKSKLVGSIEQPKLELLLEAKTGEVYRLAHIGFLDTSVFGADELRAAIPLVDGEIFNVEKMRQGLKKLADMYHAHGYINFVAVPNTEIDDQHRLITITFYLDASSN